MKRPLTDFYTDFDIERMPMRSTTASGYCFGCEDPIGQSHYRLASIQSSTVVLVCSTCGSDLKQEVIKKRLPKPFRPHMEPLTAKEKAGHDRFTHLKDGK